MQGNEGPLLPFALLLPEREPSVSTSALKVLIAHVTAGAVILAQALETAQHTGQPLQDTFSLLKGNCFFPRTLIGIGLSNTGTFQ